MTNEQPTAVRSRDEIKNLLVIHLRRGTHYSLSEALCMVERYLVQIEALARSEAEQRGAEAERRKAADVLAENARMRDALERSRKQFQFYADQHWAKNTEDGRNKAHTNYFFAVMCDAALASAPAQGGEA